MMTAQTVAGILVLAGDAPRGRAAKTLVALVASRPRPLLYAADGGAQHLAHLGLTPDLIIGDNDSLSAALFPEVARVEYPTRKDFTDGVAALQALAEACPGPLAMFGALGGRLDHMLGNLSMPWHELDDPTRLTVYDDNCECYYSRGHAEICGAPGDTLSLIPYSPIEGITLSGLAYPLDGYAGDVGDCRMISNQFCGEKAVVDHQGGLLLIIHLRRIVGE
jgi:thiamine pyrophosphokinase